MEMLRHIITGMTPSLMLNSKIKFSTLANNSNNSNSIQKELELEHLMIGMLMKTLEIIECSKARF
jgi:hypothetical protein